MTIMITTVISVAGNTLLMRMILMMIIMSECNGNGVGNGNDDTAMLIEIILREITIGKNKS